MKKELRKKYSVSLYPSIYEAMQKEAIKKHQSTSRRIEEVLSNRNQYTFNLKELKERR